MTKTYFIPFRNVCQIINQICLLVRNLFYIYDKKLQFINVGDVKMTKKYESFQLYTFYLSLALISTLVKYCCFC